MSRTRHVTVPGRFCGQTIRCPKCSAASWPKMPFLGAKAPLSGVAGGKVAIYRRLKICFLLQHRVTLCNMSVVIPLRAALGCPGRRLQTIPMKYLGFAR
jgi:hypothetical protein